MRFWMVLVSLAAAFAAASASASPLLDCPMRDAPFSIQSPLIDIFLSDAAKATIEKHAPGVIARIPPFFSNTKAPTFSAITTLEKLAPMLGARDLASLDAALRALPVTEADKVKRCERYDDDRPALAPTRGKLRVLLFEKINGFRDGPSVAAAEAAFKTMAERNGWALAVTEKAGAMHPSILRKFDVVVWNNVSGDVLTLTQRKAFRNYVEGGGGFVGIHGSAGDPVYFWDWYPDTLIGARFIGHPMAPQFQDAKIQIETNPSGIGAGLAPGWTMKDEWYSFAVSARANGATIVATLDEGSYQSGSTFPDRRSLAMGADHPIAWTRCVGKGRSFYSAIGHRPETYSDDRYLKLLEQAVPWAGDRKAKSCEQRNR
jgi:type 1 glutamine amidotransferase